MILTDEAIREKLGQIGTLCPKITKTIYLSSCGSDELKIGEMLNELYDLVLNLEQGGRRYTGGPRLAKIF